jgi:hypothetical protein
MEARTMAIKQRFQLQHRPAVPADAEQRVDEALGHVVQTVQVEKAQVLAQSWRAYRKTTKAYNGCLRAFIAADRRGDRAAAMEALREALNQLDERITLSVALAVDAAPVRQAIDNLVRVAGLLEGLGYPDAVNLREKAIALRLAASAARAPQ